MTMIHLFEPTTNKQWQSTIRPWAFPFLVHMTFQMSVSAIHTAHPLTQSLTHFLSMCSWINLAELPQGKSWSKKASNRLLPQMNKCTCAHTLSTTHVVVHSHSLTPKIAYPIFTTLDWCNKEIPYVVDNMDYISFETSAWLLAGSNM